MGRPRAFSSEAVVVATRQLFWERGYAGTTLAELEVATGLSRSSLYQAFGSKEALFAEALASYIDTFTTPALALMERPGGGLEAIRDFFRATAVALRADTIVARHGCLWVNTLAEFSGRDDPVDARAVEYQRRWYTAFGTALSDPAAGSAADAALIERRARLLVATTMGMMLVTRIDSGKAARICDSTAAEVRSWRRA